MNIFKVLYKQQKSLLAPANYVDTLPTKSTAFNYFNLSKPARNSLSTTRLNF